MNSLSRLSTSRPRGTRGRGARAGRITAIAAAIVALNLGGGWIVAQLNLQIWPQHSDIIDVLLLALVVTYIVAMALPFVPGIEIGLALMLLLGQGGILLVYLSTQIALTLAFLFGRLVPARSIITLFRKLRLERARRLMEDLDRTAPDQRLEALASRASARWITALLRHRHVALAVALNVPGNVLVGGAGGIGMIAGMSRIFAFRRYVPLVAAATSPVPLFLLLTGAL